MGIVTEKLEVAVKEKKIKSTEIDRHKKEERSLRRCLTDREKTINQLEKRLDDSSQKLSDESSLKSKLQVSILF